MTYGSYNTDGNLLKKKMRYIPNVANAVIYVFIMQI